MSSTISLNTDRRFVKRGESVNVSWNSNVPDTLTLKINDGDSIQVLSVPDSGSRLCWSNRASGNMVFTLEAITGGKKESRDVKVWVRKGLLVEPPKGDIGRFQQWKENVQAAISVNRAQFGYFWASLKTWKKLLWIAAFLLPFIMFVVALFIK